MANEFITRKGLISSGSINVSGSVTASYFKGDGSQLINLPVTTVLSSSVNIDTYTFNGDGSNKIFVLSQSYNVNSLFISVDGLEQTNITDYEVSSSTVTFVDTPPSASNVLIRALVNVTQNMTGSFSGSFLGIISTASFAQTASYALNAGAGTGFPFSGSAVITGSLQMVDTANRGGITGSVSGALTGTFPYSGLTDTPTLVSSSTQIDYNNIQNKLSGVVSSSTQVQPLLPGGTVSSSAQYPGWVTASSQIDYNSIQNKLSGVVSSSTQVQPLLPNGIISSSIGVSGYIPLWTNVMVQSSSILFQSASGRIGVNTTSSRGLVDIALASNYGTDHLVVGTTAATITAYPTTPNSAQASIVLKGSTSDARILVQDGTGRLNFLWNAYTSNSLHYYAVSSEPAARVLMGSNGSTSVWTYYGGIASSSGAQITWIQSAYIEPSSSVWFSPRGTSSDFYMNLTGNVGIGTITPGALLHVQGNISGSTATFTGNVTVQSLTETSTIKLKDNITPLNNVDITTLNPVRFTWKDTGKPDVGLIAEEVAEMFPELVEFNATGEPIGVHYTKLTILLLKTIQELKQQLGNTIK